jgi:acyl-CoA synthetase (AMP-forming)/AMP-acid ligase II
MTLRIHILGPLGSQGTYAATDTHRSPRPGSISNISGAHTTTWEQLDVADNRAANGSQNLGIGPASRVALLGKNFSRWFEILFGANKVSAVIPVNWRLAALEVRHPIKDSES